MTEYFGLGIDAGLAEAFRSAKPSDKMPALFRPADAEAVPLELTNARLLAFGAAPSELCLEGGGLILDFLPVGEETAQRLVLAFNDEGMWAVYRGKVRAAHYGF